MKQKRFKEGRERARETERDRLYTIKMILFIIDPPKGILIIRLSKAGYERQLIISARPFVALHAYIR